MIYYDLRKYVKGVTYNEELDQSIDDNHWGHPHFNSNIFIC